MPVLGEEVYADSFGAHAGGGAFITAAHLVACGKDAALCAVLPAAPFGALIQDEIEASNVDLRPSVFASPEWGHQTTIAMAHNDDRAFLTKRGGDAVPQSCQSELESGRYTHLHIAELATLIECPEILGWARGAGMTISLDCSWDVDAMRHPDAIELISKTDVFLPNLAELQFVLQSQSLVTSDVSDAFGTNCMVAIKCGADGASAVLHGQQVHADALKTDVIDTTGAGDAFNAGFIAKWIDSQSIHDCLYAGNKRAAIAVSTLGGASSVATETDCEIVAARSANS